MKDINKLQKIFVSNNQPFIVSLKRGAFTESNHQVHAVVCDNKGRILMSAGNPYYDTFIRSSLKPFQALPFVSSGTAEQIKVGTKGIAIACASHKGSTEHAREAFKLLWNSDIDVNKLKCPQPTTKKSKLEHNCSGKHAAFLATCKKMHWPLENYLEKNHPLQKEILRRVSELLNVASEEQIIEKDDCGSPTIFLQIKHMASLYAQLTASTDPELEQINRAMVQNPRLIAGESMFDTELMIRSHGQIISKGGSEGVQCIGRNGEGLGIAIKVEDGSKRAKHAVAIEILKQLEWITPTSTSELENKILRPRKGVKLEVVGKIKFQEN